MGRYYDWDISWKFWFWTQASDDADFFWVTWSTSDTLYYNYTESDLEDIEEGIIKCEDKLSPYLPAIDEYYGDDVPYSWPAKTVQWAILSRHTSVDPADIPSDEFIQEWYARLILWRKILECVKRTGECNFEAEC